MPNRLEKVVVPDKDALVTSAKTETQVAKPLGMQAEINAAVKQVDDGRAFVRPSGTENVVRVYCEAKTEAEADSLLVAMKAIVVNYVG